MLHSLPQQKVQQFRWQSCSRQKPHHLECMVEAISAIVQVVGGIAEIFNNLGTTSETWDARKPRRSGLIVELPPLTIPPVKVTIPLSPVRQFTGAERNRP
jgi:hypothetical protein